MSNIRRKIASAIGFVSLGAIIILMFYYYWTNRTASPENSSVNHLTEADKILDEDLVTHYPETPREVVKLFGRIMKALYNNSQDNEIKPLAMEVRKLYDNEFLKNNPEEAYLNNLLTDIAQWKNKDRRITNYRIVKKNLEEEKEIDGIKYSVNYITYTIQESVKFTETWKVLLRQDTNKRWRILGWEYVTDTAE